MWAGEKMKTAINHTQASLPALYRATGRSIGWWQIFANLIGALTVTSYFVFFDQVFPAMRIRNTFYVLAIMFIILAAIAFFIFNFWQKDLFRYLQLTAQNKPVEADLQKKAQRKILNMPFVSALVSFFNWFLAAITMSTYSVLSDSSGAQALAFELIEGIRVFGGTLIGGVITAAIIFFITDAKCRQNWSALFPEGGLAKMSGVFRLKLRTRMFVIFVLASILPLILMAVLSYNKASMMLEMDPGEVIQSLLYLTAFLLIVTLAVAVILSRSFSTGIIDPISQMETAMAQVEKGDLNATVTVNSNDELGALGENFNQMTEGLKDRYRLRQSLDLAKEVQQNLLPMENPHFPGLDIAGKSIYCDETGGDYHDFIELKDNAAEKLGVAVGDVAGHGISSALLMATVRSSLRQRLTLPGSISRVIADVNRQLAGDFADSGQFVTLFYLTVDPTRQVLEWVRAGHEPGIFYDPAANTFSELGGAGMALGVDKYCRYEKSRIEGFSRGAIVVLGTDGVWEARDDSGQMFGRTAIYDLIREHSAAGADDIMEAIFSQIKKFRNASHPEDDETLVVVKLK